MAVKISPAVITAPVFDFWKPVFGERRSPPESAPPVASGSCLPAVDDSGVRVMWNAVTPQSLDAAAPSSRTKHSATLLGGHLYLLGGRNGNVGLKDFWRYNIIEGRWEQLLTGGETPPCLQEHTAVAFKDCLYVFGGEVGFSSATETPLWVYQVGSNSWRKVRSPKGVQVPRGRRGHTALIYQGAMIIYGGYQDLRGSTNELWAFDFNTESWHLLSGRGRDEPPARHKHSAVMHDGAMWVFGGMTDLQTRSDLWRWDALTKIWVCVRAKHGPGPLQGHAACKVAASMLIFGGERGDGNVVDELWRFHFATESWERITPVGMKPSARAESAVLVVTEAPTAASPTVVAPRPRSVERRVPRSSSTLGQTQQQEPAGPPSLFGRLSSVNLTARLSRCSYSVLSNDSAESDAESAASAIIKSASMHAGVAQQARSRMSRDPVSVPNFASAPLTPVEAARLVFVDSSDDEAETGWIFMNPAFDPSAENEFTPDPDDVLDFPSLHQRFQPTRRIAKSASVRFNLEEPDSDYASVASTTPHDGPLSFSNPNYLGPDIGQMLNSPPDSLLQDPTGRFHSQDQIELKTLAAPAPRRAAPPTSLPLEGSERQHRMARALSAGRAERRKDPTPPLYMYVVGGREKGHAALFKRSVSMWRLCLHPSIFVRR
ncbi:F-box only protein 42-like isoform X1 [Cloeon dipterum]|uniref:F-box only protein 42-like isoform X1 n=1 Tax=Cloeon dipterum TaxID=197152 RepID=UPI00321FC7AE